MNIKPQLISRLRIRPSIGVTSRACLVGITSVVVFPFQITLLPDGQFAEHGRLVLIFCETVRRQKQFW